MITKSSWWSFSEFLNLVELRSQCWCLLEMGSDAGFNIPHTERVLFYAVLRGSARLERIGAEPVDLSTGSVAMVLNGDAHAVRVRDGNAAEVFDFLYQGEYVDIPPVYNLGEDSCTRLLCGSLKVRWPGAQRPKGLPPVLISDSSRSLIRLDVLIDEIDTKGASALLTKATSLFFTAAIRNDPRCEEVFRETTREDPIVRARHFMEIHPFTEWTLDRLAWKVGMSRSNFSAKFFARHGKTPMRFLTELRMEHAARLLQETDLKIATIGEHVGYRSESAFSRRFTEQFGVAPGRYRLSAEREGEARVASAVAGKGVNSTAK